MNTHVMIDYICIAIKRLKRVLHKLQKKYGLKGNFPVKNQFIMFIRAF